MDSVPVVATWGRWAAGTAALALATVAGAQLYLGFTHSQRPLGSFAGDIVVACALGALVLFLVLRAEESRLTRELRTARAGTAVLRAMVVRRRQALPFFARLFATQLGMAAVLLADGDRPAALDALAAGSFFSRGGRLDKVRFVVEQDLERALGTSVSLERCVANLREVPRLGHREADLYRTHVLVKAVLEQGDAETACEIAEGLASSTDEEERVYLSWLRVWFDLDAAIENAPWPELTDADIRVAALAARAHGANRLVEMLDAARTGIARRKPQG